MGSLAQTRSLRNRTMCVFALILFAFGFLLSVLWSTALTS